MNDLNGAASGGAAQAPTQQEPTEVEKPVSPSDSKWGLTRTALVKETKAADELVAMILHDLSQIEGCQKRGLRVKVYGF